MDIVSSYGFYMLLGAVAGTLSGLLGIGGGIIVVPGLIWLFKHQGYSASIVMGLAVSTSLAVIIVTATSSVIAHARRGSRFSPTLYVMIPGLVIGSLLGSLTVHHIQPYLLKILFSLLLFLTAYKGLFTTTPLANNSHAAPKITVIVISAVAIGILSGLLGVGGGVLLMPFLQYYCAINIRNAVGISAACGAIVAVIGTISAIISGWHQPNLPPQTIGYIYFPAFMGIAISSCLFAFVGTKLHHLMPVKTLQRLFSLFLIAVGIELLI